MSENWQHIHHQKFASLDLFTQRRRSVVWQLQQDPGPTKSADVACQKNDEASASLFLYTLKDLQKRIQTELEGGGWDELGNVPKQGDEAG